jgi:hypothetical protein
VQANNVGFPNLFEGLQEALPLSDIIECLDAFDECFGVERLQQILHQTNGRVFNIFHLSTIVPAAMGHWLSM